MGGFKKLDLTICGGGVSPLYAPEELHRDAVATILLQILIGHQNRNAAWRVSDLTRGNHLRCIG